jgi:hypothetical protein
MKNFYKTVLVLVICVVLEKSVLAQEKFGKVVTYSSNATTLIGQVTVNGVAAGDGDVVAIYVGEELRGKQEVIVNEDIGWLNVQVHAKGGDEAATFKVFDATANAVFHVPNFTVTISPALSVGSFGSPVIVEAVGDMPDDIMAPGAPTVTGMSPTTDTRPALSGTAEPGSTVTVYDGGIELGTATAGSDGAYTFIPGSALEEAKHIITAKATDRAGNTSQASGTFSLVIDLEVVAGEDLGNVKTYTNIATTLIGQVTIDGEASGVGDIVGIYVGEELRGKNEVIVNGGTAWLNAQVNAAGGDETATFKVYDASTGVTYDTIDLSVVIKPEGEVGSFGEPLLIKVVGVGPVDTTAPVITLAGDVTVTVEVGSNYSDAGASASDAEDGDLTGSIEMISTVNTEAEGSYRVTYNVKDLSGNEAVEVVRFVVVKPPLLETIPLVVVQRQPFTFSFMTQIGVHYEVEFSKDLPKWIKVKEIYGTDGSVQFTDDRNFNESGQFYRLRMQ